MPAPPAPFLEGQIRSGVTDLDMSIPSLNEFITSVSRDISLAWTQWALGLTGGLNTVTGAGIGAWAGSGFGGKIIQSSPLQVNYTYSKPSPEWDQLKAAIASGMKVKFTAYSSGFLFGPIPYIGTSGATPVSPGPVVAFNTPAPLIGYKSFAPTVDGLAKLIRSQAPPDWLQKPETLDAILDAIENAVKKGFMVWESTSVFSGDQFIGVGTPGAGLATGPSLGTGLIA